MVKYLSVLFISSDPCTVKFYRSISGLLIKKFKLKVNWHVENSWLIFLIAFGLSHF